LRIEERIALDHEMVVAADVQAALQQVAVERREPDALLKAGLHPTRTILFTGPPGVGKTMAARWMARELDRPLLTLDLAAVMSSLLGRTGNNLRQVLDYAKSVECVLLLDELDALAKRRDDQGEIGELKRLVTVLLQEVDDWPASGLLVAATNHPRLLDPAAWRRFEMIVEFDLPDPTQIERLVTTLLKPYFHDYEKWAKILAFGLKGKSQNDIEREITRARRAAVTSGQALDPHLKGLVQADDELSRAERIELARLLQQSGVTSQREAGRITGVSRDTIRKFEEANHEIREKMVT
jgi:SpoVK/Ycf46/Vps4 family AAA+-type ATPase